MDEGARLESVWTGNCLASSNLALSAINIFAPDFNKFGRARRGGSGALYPQSATAGLNSRPRV